MSHLPVPAARPERPPALPSRHPAPLVIDAPPLYRIEDSPLHGRCRLAGRIVTDPAERAAIAARIEWFRRPAWRRALLRLAGRGPR